MIRGGVPAVVNGTMKQFMKSLAGVVLFVILAAGVALGQTTPSIEGRIGDPRGYVMHGLTVTARDMRTGAEAQTTSDDRARFAFYGLEPGRYAVFTGLPGLREMLTAVDVRPGETARITFVASELRPTGIDALDKFYASMERHGGRYPSGNLSYLNVNNAGDVYFMAVYFGILILLSFYGVYRYRMVYLFLRYRKHTPRPKAQFAPDRLPRVTVQLPLFNEMYVAERLIDSAVRLDYPRELLEIQVLDDSTDETTAIVAAAVEKYAGQGINISHHHRANRAGFKAGALEAGLKQAAGELILIFDADFTPRPDCVRKLVDYFTDEQVGMVQMRWSHINADYSLLTKVQAIMLDGHFVIEQTSRHRAGGFFNFNGTAGMWRRQAIEWSGGWQHDTLAEDTDLSYRAQLMGWRFVYLVDEDVPAELPVEINAFKSQQRRWAKGLVQVGLKLFKRMWNDPRLPLQARLEQFFRLTGNLAAPLVIVLALVNFPILIVRYNQGFFHLFVLDVPILTLTTLSVVLFYVIPQMYLHPRTWKSTLKYMPFVMSMGIALTFSNARAVLEALFGVKSGFVRTPKYRIEDKQDTTWLKKRYVPRRIALPWLELLFAVYFALTIYYAVASRTFGTIPFLLIYFFGYAYASYLAIAQSGVKR